MLRQIARFQEIDDEVLQPEDLRTRRPDRAAIEAESATTVDNAYLLYLQLYLLHFGKLSAKEQHALTMVEVDGVSYRDAAADLGIRLENLKMVIFRGRRKIFRGMQRSLGEFAAAQTNGVVAAAGANRRNFDRSAASAATMRDRQEAGA